jgi:hypothetical protein
LCVFFGRDLGEEIILIENIAKLQISNFKIQDSRFKEEPNMEDYPGDIPLPKGDPTTSDQILIVVLSPVPIVWSYFAVYYSQDL